MSALMQDVHLTRDCDCAADLGSEMALRGRQLDLTQINALRSGRTYPIADLALVAWAANLGHREGAALREERIAASAASALTFLRRQTA